MFCRNCSSKLKDNIKFCPKCGNSVEQPIIQSIDNKIHETNESNKTAYANTSFWLAIVGIPLYFFCGMGIFLEILAFILGILAVKNKEKNSILAWVGLSISAVATFLTVVIMMSD